MGSRGLMRIGAAALALLIAFVAARAAPGGGPGRQGLPQPPDTASYRLDVTLDPAAKTVGGEGVITYTNPSADTLDELWLRLYLKAFSADDTLWMRESGGAHRGYAADEARGDITLSRLALADGTDLLATSTLTDTLLRVPLPRPLGPNERIELAVAWESQLPRVFARTGYGGRDDTFFMVGQWYPKLAVYDRGRWDTEPWHTNAEFFNDFGRYEVTIAAPSEYVIAAAGVPAGAAVQDGALSRHSFVADGVTDFAFAASPDFIVHTAPAGEAEVMLFLMPERRGSAQRYLDVAVDALLAYGDWYGPYPHPRLTVVDVPESAGGAGGMEYPTLVTGGTLGLPEGTRLDEMVLAHEIGHQWWPMQTATNEAQEPWLDEGLTEYSGARLMEETGRQVRLGPAVDVPALDLGGYASDPGVRADLPAAAYDGEYAIAVYNKPAVGLMTLERTVGTERFRGAMAAYLAEWRYRHPTAADFRAVMERELGDLSWFFDDFIATEGQIGYRALPLDDGSATVERTGAVPAPVEVEVRFADGGAQLFQLDGADERVTLDLAGRAPVALIVDPAGKLYAELDKRDNAAYTAPRPLATMALGARLAFWLQTIVQTIGLFG